MIATITILAFVSAIWMSSIPRYDASLLEDVAVVIQDRAQSIFGGMFDVSLEQVQVRPVHAGNVLPTTVVAPTIAPTFEPTEEPTFAPTEAPTMEPVSFAPTTYAPSFAPTLAPVTSAPSFAPSFAPSTSTPSFEPTFAPTTLMPTFAPTTLMPTFAPTTSMPTFAPTVAPSTLAPSVPSVSTLAPTTRAPTRTPTHAPTAQTSPVITFSSGFTLSGLNSTELDESAQSVLIQSTAVTLNVSEDSVTYLGTTVVSRRLRSSTSVVQQQQQVHLAGFTVVANLQVSVLLSSYGSSNATAVYQALQTTLVTAVTSGAFQTLMQSTAAAMNVTVLETATADSVAVVLEEVDAPPPASADSDDKLSDGEIAGAVIGSVAGFAILCALLYYFFFTGSKVAIAGSRLPTEEQGMMLVH